MYSTGSSGWSLHPRKQIFFVEPDSTNIFTPKDYMFWDFTNTTR